MYQLYMHLYTKICNMILILKEQASFKRMYKKLACIEKYLYKLRTSFNKLRNECTSGRNSRIESTRSRSSVISCTRKPRRFCNARNRWKNKNQVGDWQWWWLPPECHCNKLKFPSKSKTKVNVPSCHVKEPVETAEVINISSSFITASKNMWVESILLYQWSVYLAQYSTLSDTQSPT